LGGIPLLSALAAFYLSNDRPPASALEVLMSTERIPYTEVLIPVALPSTAGGGAAARGGGEGGRRRRAGPGRGL
jgi:hypothetical protein